MKWIGTQTIYDHVRLIKGITLDSVSITTIQSSGESFADNDTSLMTSAAVDDRINTAVTAEDLDLTADSGTAAVDLNSQALAVTGGTGITTSATGQAVTINADATQAQITSLGSAGATTDIAAGDLTMYNNVNDGNPTISLGSSATNKLEIKSVYNSGTTSLCDVDFTTYTSSVGANDGRFNFLVDEVETLSIKDELMNLVGAFTCLGYANVTNKTASSATEGGRLRLQADDGAAMADNHRLGVIEFRGAEDGVGTRSIGARIEAIARDAWDGSNNDADLEFYTTDGTTESKVLTLDADKNARFEGTVTVGVGFTGDLTGDVTGDCSGTAATVTGGTQAAITSTANLVTVGTIGTGVWQGTAVASAYLDADTAHYSAQKQLTYHSYKADQDTTKTYLGLLDADSEETATSSKVDLPLTAPVAGKLLKVFLRSNKNINGHTLTWRLETISSGANFSSTPAIIGTQSGAGCQNTAMTTYDFTTGLDSGTNAIAAADAVHLSLQSDTDFGGNVIYYITCLWEWDLS